MNTYHYKQAILVRTDLRMGRGKAAVQVAHASVSASEHARIRNPDWWREWFAEGQCKIVLKVNGEAEILRFKAAADKEGLPNYLVEDRGLTQIPPGSVTCLAIGPGPSERIDKLTSGLPLF